MTKTRPRLSAGDTHPDSSLVESLGTIDVLFGRRELG